MKIGIIGAGYVGLSLATMLSRNNDIFLYDISNKKIQMIRNKKCPIDDNLIKQYFKNNKTLFKIATSYLDLSQQCDLIVICINTDYNNEKGHLETVYIERIIEEIINANKNIGIIIKSTVPIGFTKSMREKYKSRRIIYSPEFLREGKGLYDNLYPSRIIIGGFDSLAKQYASILKKSIQKKETIIKFMYSDEAEAVKLFSNAYLAMRISFFNELDTFAEMKNLNTKRIIEGVCLDNRIGMYYNNPSFGYGGYCLPKDTKQLITNFKGIPEELISSIIKSNSVRKKFVANNVLKNGNKIIGIYKLSSKINSNNFTNCAIKDIIENIRNKVKEIIIYEPKLNTDSYCGIKIEKDLKKFKEKSDIILSNRKSKKLLDVKEKVYTRDVFNIN